MDILLWRHAEAEDGPDDMNRALTKKGREQARAMADWLNRFGPQQRTILCSPALRTMQTADTLGETYRIVDAIGPSGSEFDLLDIILDEFAAGTAAIVLIGHQPHLGRLATRVLIGSPFDCAVTKGAVWWIATPDPSQPALCKVRAVITPKLASRSSITGGD